MMVDFLNEFNQMKPLLNNAKHHDDFDKINYERQYIIIKKVPRDIRCYPSHARLHVSGGSKKDLMSRGCHTYSMRKNDQADLSHGEFRSREEGKLVFI